MTTHASPRMFAQITKIDAAKREVWGRLAHEVPDRADEIFDYESSKPHFKAWSEEFAKATDGKSLGNLRAMHGKVAAGKFIAINFNDAEKAIDVGAKVVDQAEWEKCEQGVYTGFSIGGSYVGDKKAEKIDGRDVKRYTATPTEGSLVDSPCIPTAKFFDIVKADGAIEKVAFKAPELVVEGTDDQVAELAKLMGEQKLDMAAVLVLVKAAGVTPAEPHPLVKAATELVTASEALAKATDDAALIKARADHSQKIHDMLGEMGAKCTKEAPTGDLTKLTKFETDLAGALAEIEKLKKQPVPYVTLRAVARGEAAKEKPDVEKITVATLTPTQLILNADGTPDYGTSVNVAREKALAAWAASNP